MNTILYPALLIFIPVGVGILLFLIPKKVKAIREILALLAAGGAFAGSLLLFFLKVLFTESYELIHTGLINFNFQVKTTPFNVFLLLFLTFAGFCITLYSISFMSGKRSKKEYYPFLLVTIGAGCGVLLANNFILFLIFWEIVSISLYFLITTGNAEARNGATKTMVMIGFSDACLLLGIGLVWFLGKTFTISDIAIPLDNWISYCAFFLILTGALTKAGSVPFHTWIPAASKGAPAPVMAMLPGSIDKLLGLYLLVLVSIKLFTVTFALKIILMIIGAVTIVIGGMMALVQKKLPELLSYSTVSQVGYITLGIGTMNPIAIAGALFHALNNALYKSTLFLGGGAVEQQTKTQDLENLGGLAKVMPFTFIAFFIATLSISGVPPFNGFVSKWMIYQGTIDSPAGVYSYIFLIAAMAGSGLTLAALIKAMYSVFLGKKTEITKKVNKDAGILMQIPMIIMSLLCILFGVVSGVPVKFFINPAINSFNLPEFTQKGIFDAPVITIFIIAGLVIGLVIYFLGSTRKTSKKVNTFVGGEVLAENTSQVPGTTMFKAIRTMKPFQFLYTQQEKGLFDPYERFGKIGDFISSILKRIHSGYLPFYLSWTILGFVIFIVLFIII